MCSCVCVTQVTEALRPLCLNLEGRWLSPGAGDPKPLAEMETETECVRAPPKDHKKPNSLLISQKENQRCLATSYQLVKVSLEDKVVEMDQKTCCPEIILPGRRRSRAFF